MKFVVFFLVTAVVLFAWSQATPQICGDVNDDGGYNIGDAVYLVSYLYNGGPEPPAYTYADADGYRVLTPNDLILIMTHRPATCPPTQRKFSGPPNSGYPLRLDSDTWPAGVSTKTVKIQLNTATPFIYTEMPLFIYIGNELPDVVSCTPDPDMADWSDVSSGCHIIGSGRVLLSYADTAYAPIGPFDVVTYPEGKTMATLQLSLSTPPAADQDIRLSWDMACPPVNSTYGSSHYPVLLVSWDRGYPLAYTPALPGERVPSLTVWGGAFLAALLMTVGVWLLILKRRPSVTVG